MARLRAAALGSLVVLGACAGSAPAPSSSTPLLTAPSSSSEPPATSAPGSRTPGGAGACTNDYLPVVRDATRTYRLSSNAGAGSSYTDTVTDVRRDGFTIASTFAGGASREASWSCTARGLVALQFAGTGSSSGIGLGGASFDLKTTKVSGVTLPTNARPGDSWTQTFSVAGSLDVPGFGSAVRASGEVDYDYHALRTQTVTVPAGTFEALAIAADLRFHLAVDIAGVRAPVPLSFRSTEWYARGVGQVKSRGGGDIAGGAVEETAVLTSYKT